MAKKKRSKGSTTTLSNRVIVTCKGKCKGAGEVQYFCSDKKVYFCYDDSHMSDIKKYCCRFSWNVRSGVLEKPIEEEEAAGSSPFDEDLSGECEYKSKGKGKKKKCKSTDAEYWCERKQKWLCGDHYHTGGCCTHYGADSGGEESSSRDDKPMKEVKFANS